MKAIPFLLTALTNIGVGVVLFFFLIVGLNGFSEKQAQPGLIFFVVWVALVSLLAGVLSVVLTKFFETKQSLNFWIAALLAILISAFAGTFLSVVGWVASLLIADAMR